MTSSSYSLNKKSKPDSEKEKFERLSPDGGWGWIVCFGAFMINFIADGTMFSFGILFMDLLDYFQDSKFKTSIVGSSQLGLSMMMGPVVSVLLRRFTCRQVTIFGGILASVSLIISVFSPNIEVMIVTYGILCGTGICMMYMTSIIAVGLYFNKRRAIATGIATSGAGVGVFVYGYLLDYLLQIYEWKGTVLILAGLMLNCVVCGALFRPMEPVVIEDKLFDLASTSSGYGGSSEEQLDQESHSEEVEVLSIPPHDKCVKNNVLYSPVRIFHPSRTKSAEDINLISVKEVDPRLHVSAMVVSPLAPETKSERIAKGLLHPMLRKDIFYSGSISHLPDYDACGGSLTSFLAQMTRDQSVTDDEESHTVSKSRVKLLYDVSLCKDPTFWILLIICTFWTVQSVPITYVPDLAVSVGINRSQAALLISIVGIANTFGRVFAGFANDFLSISSVVLYLVAFILGSVVNFIMPFCDTFTLIAISTAGFGLCMAVAVSMRTIVIADLMRIERLTQSFGLISFAQGAAFIFNPPLAGMFMDITGTYMAPFFMAAILYSLSAILCLILIIQGKKSQVRMNNRCCC